MLESSPAKRDLGVLDHFKANMSQQCALVARKATFILGCIKADIASLLSEEVVLLCSTLLQPHLKHYVLFWAPQYKKEIKPLENIQRSYAKVVKCLDFKTYKE